MGKGRLEAFTDGVFAIIITIMVLELKVPEGSDLSALASSIPVLLAYVLSFVNVGIFWVNHHHMLHATDRVDGKVLWANLFLLFWLSLVPFVIRWMDEAGLTALPTAAYGACSTWPGSAIPCCNGRSWPVMAAAPGSPLRSETTSRARHRSSPTPRPFRSPSSIRGSPSPSTSRSRSYGWCPTGELNRG